MTLRHVASVLVRLAQLFEDEPLDRFRVRARRQRASIVVVTNVLKVEVRRQQTLEVDFLCLG